MDHPFYQLNIASIVLTVILFAIFIVRKSYPTLSRKLFRILIAFSAFSSAMEILIVLTANLNFAELGKEFLLIGYNLIHFTLHYIFLLYVTSSVRNVLASKAEKIVFSTIYVCVCLLLLTNPLHHIVYSFDDVGNFVFGIGYSVLEGFGFLSLIYAFILTLVKRKSLTKLQFGLDIFFLLIWQAAILAETFIRNFYIENFIISVTVLLCTIAADNPDRYFVEETSVYNEFTFDIVYSQKLKQLQSFRLICFNFEDFDLYKQRIGAKKARYIMNRILTGIKKDFGQKNVFALDRDVIALDATFIKNLDETCELILNRSYKFGIEQDADLKLNAQFTIINCPSDCENLSDLHSGINMMLFDPQNVSDTLIDPFNVKLLERKHRRENIIMKIHDAIENDGFEIYFQPLYDWKKDKYIALEALIRFKDTGSDFISPSEFIPIAEEEGLIFDIDEIVFEKVCRFIRNTDIKKYGVEFVDINLSLLKLLDSATIDRYSELVSRYNIAPSFINLEITETAEGDGKYLDTVKRNIALLREKGFNFSLDDYGSGYSTVVYMAEMDAKIVKIDASILWNAMKNRKYYTVLENCVRLIYCFDKQCVCEGVEDENMANILQRLGVNYFQGYNYSKPINEHDILILLADKNKIKS